MVIIWTNVNGSYMISYFFPIREMSSTLQKNNFYSNSMENVKNNERVKQFLAIFIFGVRVKVVLFFFFFI